MRIRPDRRESVACASPTEPFLARLPESAERTGGSRVDETAALWRPRIACMRAFGEICSNRCPQLAWA